MTEPVFPPLLQSIEAGEGEDPVTLACALARNGCDAGLIAHALTPTALSAAIVLAPEVDLEKAMVMVPLCGVALQNAIGALAPPEVAVHLEWPGILRVNGGRCGNLRAAAPATDGTDQPDWMVVAFDLRLWPDDPETGRTPDDTALFAEGCAGLEPVSLLESWGRHMLLHINRWTEDGPGTLQLEWRSLAWKLGEDVQYQSLSGRFLGIDEAFGMVLKVGETTHLIPLTTLLETA